MCGLEEMLKNEIKIDNPVISKIKLSLQVQSPNLNFHYLLHFCISLVIACLQYGHCILMFFLETDAASFIVFSSLNTTSMFAYNFPLFSE